jgi:hypothetical protein
MSGNNGNSLSVIDSLRNKIRGGFTLTSDEREKLEDLLIDNYSEWLEGSSDEDLLNEAAEVNLL